LRGALAVAALFLSVFATPISAQDSAHNFTAMDEFQLQIAADPQISPDGKRVVYVRRFADSMTDKRYSNLWVINSDGTDQRPFPPAIIPTCRPVGRPTAPVSPFSPTPTASSKSTSGGWTPAKPRASQISSKRRTLLLVSRWPNDFVLRARFSVKVRTLPICPRHPPARNG